MAPVCATHPCKSCRITGLPINHKRIPCCVSCRFMRLQSVVCLHCLRDFHPVPVAVASQQTIHTKRQNHKPKITVTTVLGCELRMLIHLHRVYSESQGVSVVVRRASLSVQAQMTMPPHVSLI